MKYKEILEKVGDKSKILDNMYYDLSIRLKKQYKKLNKFKDDSSKLSDIHDILNEIEFQIEKLEKLR